MTQDNRSTEVDYTINFDTISPLASLVEETYEFKKEENQALDADALMKNAKVLLTAGDAKLAKRIFRALIERGELLGPAYAGIGSIFELEKKLELAVKAYREAIIYDPSYSSLYALAELYIKQSDHNNAAGTLLRAHNLNTLSPEQSFEIHKSLGSCYMHLGQLNNAEAHYRKAYELFPQSAALHVNIGSLALKKSDPATSLLHFKEAARMEPKNAEAYIGIGLSHMAGENKELAHDAFLAALKIDILQTQALYNLVRCAYELKNFGAAIEMLQEYMRHSPVNSNLLFSYAGILYHQGSYDLAKEECEKLLSLKPEHAGANKILQLINARAKKNG